MSIKRKSWLYIGASGMLAAALLVVSLVLMGNSARAKPTAGEISGTLTYNTEILGDQNMQAVVFTRTQDPLPAPVAIATRSGPGRYNISQTIASADLPNDTYYVMGVVDMAPPGPSEGDMTAWYDPEGDGMPNPVTIQDGAVNDVNIYIGGPWTPTGGPSIPGGQVNDLVIGYRYSMTGSLLLPGTLYAAVGTPNNGGDTQIYKSIDQGDTWAAVFYPGGDKINALAVNDVYTPSGGSLYLPRNVYAGGDGGRVYNSADGGATWATVFTGTDPMTYGWSIDALATGPLTSPLVYAGGHQWRHDVGQDRGVLYRSQDGGATWTLVLTTPEAGNEGRFNAVAIHPDDPDVAYAAGGENYPGDPALYSIIYQTTDGGDHWTRIYTGTHPWFATLAIHPLTPTIVYAGSSQAWEPSYVFRSEDGGTTWTKVFTYAGRQLALVPPNTVYAIGGCTDVYRSTSGGDPGTWNQANGPESCIQSLAADASAASILYAGTNERGVFRSTDDAGSWQERNNGIQTIAEPRDVDVDPQNLAKLFVAAECSGGWVSTDGGQSYAQPSGLSGCMGAFAINPQDSNVVYGGAYDCSRGAVLRSADGGLNFEPVYTASHIISDCSGGGEQIYDLAVAPSMTATVYAAGSDNFPPGGWPFGFVVRSLDDGASWTEVLTLEQGSQVQLLAVAPTDADIVYAGGEDCSAGPCQGFIYRTINGGDQWTLVFTSTSQMASLVIDPQKPEVLYAADRNYSVYKTSDGGDTWRIVRRPPWEGGGPSGDQLAIDPHVPSHVYLGGYGYIAESVDGGQTWSDWGHPINQGTPGMPPQALAVDDGTLAQTLYAGFSGLWYYRRAAPQPGGPMTITMWTDPASGPIYANGIDGVFYHGLVVDRFQNWVADGTALTVNYNTQWGVNVDLPKSTVDGYVTGGWMNVRTPGVITFTATAVDNMMATDFVTMAFLYNPPSIITATVTPTSVNTGGETAVVSATVGGEHGGIASDGTVVTFTTDLGTVVPTITVSLNGVATTTLTSGEISGTTTIMATTDGLSDSVEVTFTEKTYYLYLPLTLRSY